VEWVNIQHSMANDKYLVRCLTHLLSDPRLQQSAGDCLLALVGWRAGKTTERAHLLCLFDTEMMSSLFAATEEAEKQSLDCDHYTFLKRMVEILTVLGDQLCYLWTKDTPRPSLPNLSTYLDALLAFTRHPSQTVSHMANELWTKFFRHTDIGADPSFLSYRPKWLALALRRAVKVGQPSREDNPACAYSQLDHDNDEEFHNFFTKYRLCIVEGVRTIATTAPLQPMELLSAWLQEVLAAPALPALEAISCLLEASLGRLAEAEQVRPVAGLAVPLLQLLLSHPAAEPLLVSELLSCTSALFPCVLVQPSALQPVLAKIFAPLAAANPDNSK
jgi:exportin-5